MVVYRQSLARKKAAAFATIAVAFALSGCGSSVKDTLGMTRRAPDEFRVVSRPPLSVPPEFNLRPPAQGNEVSGTETDTNKEAQSLIFGTNLSAGVKPGSAETAIQPVTTNDLASSSDAKFLQNAGTQNADPTIRETLAKEAPDPEVEKSFLDKINDTSKKEPLVDAKGEAERLKTNKEADKPVTEGETPTVKQRDRGVLGKILGD